MSRRVTPKSKTILAFGESLNDTKSLKEIVAGLRPDLPAVSPRIAPLILRRGTNASKLAAQVSMVERLIKAESVKRQVIAIIAHRDLDSIECSESVHVANDSESELARDMTLLSKSGIVVIATVPAWEIEAWWFMWPEQVAKHRPSWSKLPDRTGKRVDLIYDAKRTLRDELKVKGGRACSEYSETDSPLIAERIRIDGVVRQAKGRSFAFERFVKAVDEIRAG